MNIYLIDPTRGTILPHEYDADVQGWDHLRELMECRLIEPVGLSNGDYIYLDEEGSFVMEREDVVHFFKFEDASYGETQPLFGRAVYIGSAQSDDGRVDAKPKLSIEEVIRRTTFFMAQTKAG